MPFSVKILSKYFFQGGISFVIVSTLISGIYCFYVYGDYRNHYFLISIGQVRSAYISLLCAGIFSVISAVAFLVSFFFSICDLESFTIATSLITGLISLIGLVISEGLYMNFNKYDNFYPYPPAFDYCQTEKTFSKHTSNLKNIVGYEVDCCNVSDMMNYKCSSKEYEIYPFPGKNTNFIENIYKKLNPKGAIKTNSETTTSEIDIFKEWVNYFFFRSEYKIGFTLLDSINNKYWLGYVPPCYPTSDCKNESILSCAREFQADFVIPFEKEAYSEMSEVECKALDSCFKCIDAFEPGKELRYQTRYFIREIKQFSITSDDPAVVYGVPIEFIKSSKGVFDNNHVYRVLGLLIPCHVIPVCAIIASVMIQVVLECCTTPSDPEDEEQ